MEEKIKCSQCGRTEKIKKAIKYYLEALLQVNRWYKMQRMIGEKISEMWTKRKNEKWIHERETKV